GKVLIDLQGAFFSNIITAYSSKPKEAAHATIAAKLRQFARTSSAVVCIDGDRAQEKSATNKERDETRRKALGKAEASIRRFKDRVDIGLGIRKQHHQDIRKHLRNAFTWSSTTKNELATYLRDQGWRVVQCDLEADTAIARDCTNNDVVLTRDSDAIVYQSIPMIWRPVGRKILVYDKERLLSTLGLTRQQMTALGIVSHNDYNRNIPTLGSATNLKLVKNLEATDVRALVQKYLNSPVVQRKNRNQETFSASMNVFVDLRQTSAPAFESRNPVLYESMRSTYNQLCEKQKEQRSASAISGTKPNRHKPSQQFNRYRTVESPDQRPRYSHKTRIRKIKHDPPPVIAEYTWKPWKEPPETPETPETPKIRQRSKKRRKMNALDQGTDTGRVLKKTDMYYKMSHEHPIVTLDVGTLKANIHRATTLGDTQLEAEVLKTIQEIVHHAGNTKRTFQSLIGQFIERLLEQEEIQESDREILDLLCPRIVSADLDVAEDNEVDDEDGEVDGEDGEVDEDLTKEDSSDQAQFIRSVLQYLWSRNRPVGKLKDHVTRFICRLQELGLLEMRSTALVNVPTKYPGSYLLKSTCSQLCAEFKRLYKHGSKELVKQLETMKKKGSLPIETEIAIHDNLSSIENFIRLNRLGGNRRRIISLTKAKDTMVTIAESNLLPLLLKNPAIKTKICQMIGVPEDGILQKTIETWFSTRNPGTLVTSLITDTGTGVTAMRRPGIGKSYCNVTKTLSLTAINDHVTRIQAAGFNPGSYTERGYVMTGTIRTDGFRLQVLAWKLKELQAVRYKRLPQELLPPRITSTVGGTNHYLSEIRNVVKTPQDIVDIWGCSASDISILGIDVGQAYVVGASALLVSPVQEHEETAPSKVYHNLAVNQKAVYQPTLKYRRWLETSKNQPAPDSGISIADIESSMPPLRGDSASITKFVPWAM
ncbi:hypothetical protein BGX31_008846, partial [Mortierella sp. GBA43]